METVYNFIDKYNTWAKGTGMTPFDNFFLGLEVYAVVMALVLVFIYIYRLISKKGWSW